MFGVETALSEVTGLTSTAILLMAFAGLVVGIAPSSFPLMAAAVGFAAGGQSAAPAGGLRGFWLSTGFVLGVALVDALLGALFGLFGFLILRALAAVMVYAYFGLSLILLLLGLALLGVIRVNIRLLYAAPRAVGGFWPAFLLGIPFGLSTCPACTPLVLPVLMTAAGSSDFWTGGVLLFVFGLARGIPIIVVGTATHVFARMHRMMFWVPRIERVAGVLLLIAAAAFGYQAGVYAGFLPPIVMQQ